MFHRHARALALLVAVPTLAAAYIYKPVLNIQTGRPDLITPLDNTTVQGGTNVTVTSNADGTVTVNTTGGGGGGGGSAAIAVNNGTSGHAEVNISSPTNNFNFNSNGFAVTLQGGATAFISLSPTQGSIKTFTSSITINDTAGLSVATVVSASSITVSTAIASVATISSASFVGNTSFLQDIGVRMAPVANTRLALSSVGGGFANDILISIYKTPASIVGSIGLGTSGTQLGIFGTGSIEMYANASKIASFSQFNGFQLNNQMDANSNKIITLSNGTADTDAINLRQLRTLTSSTTITNSAGLLVQGPVSMSSFTATAANLTTTSMTVTGAGGLTVTNLSASLPVQTDTNKTLTSAAIDLSGTQATGALAAGRFPALTGDITTSAGSLATTAAATQANIRTFTSSITVQTEFLTSTITISQSGTVPNALPNAPLQVVGTVNSYLQANIMNFSSGTSASSDYIATSDKGSDASNYIDVGINSSAFNQTTQSVVPSTAGYVYTSDHSLVIMAGTNGLDANAQVVIVTSAPILANTRMVFNSTGSISVYGPQNITQTIGSNSLSVSSSASGNFMMSVSSTPATNPTDFLLSISSANGALAFGVQNNSHVISSGTTPSMGSCGTSPSVDGTDNAGIITVGAGIVTSCALNFSSTYTRPPICTISTNSTAVTADITSITGTVATFGFSATLAGGTVWYICVGNKG